MRITNDTSYDEPRDSIAGDWSKYMLSAFPDSQFIFIPNIKEDVEHYLKGWDIDVLILSGGDDLGTFPARDKTEILAFLYALKMKIPVIAVCRGLQLVHSYFGGKIESGDNNFIEKHRATKHIIDVDDISYEVNSYHTNVIIEETVHKNFEIFARCKDDNSIEGLRSKQVLGMMWHPERDESMKNWNKLLIEKFIKNER